MLVDPYYSTSEDRISFTREQGSNFAKQVADGFNPIHDPDARRFCIPGDLLFSIILARYGLSQRMEVAFTGMVVDGIELVLPEPAEELEINDTAGRQYLTIGRSGDSTSDASLIDRLARVYVEFSGHTFPHILVPLLAEQNVMINPERPVVMYDSMTLDLDRLDLVDPLLVQDHNELSINGKRGEVRLVFNIVEGGQVVGRGRKRMILSGLREYDEGVMADTIASFNRWKLDFQPA